MLMLIEHKMTITNQFIKRLQSIIAMCLLFAGTAAQAVELAVKSSNNVTGYESAEKVANAPSVLDYLTDSGGKYVGPTVEDNILAMDSDKNGFADVFEVRAFLTLKHGKDYQKDLLDKWEASANGKSCSTPFAKELVTDKDYTKTTSPNN